MKAFFSGEEIPGMIEPIEQILLESLARDIKFHEGDCVVEFGTFFGRSTSCICKGLKNNATFKRGSRFYAYDSFECDRSGGFYPYVASFAKSANIENLLQRKDSKVNFSAIFEYFLNGYIKDGILVVNKLELADSFPECDTIRLIHIDSPKFYNEFKYILYRFFPKLETNSVIIFQDFFYHWSATIIAVCALMINRGFLVAEESAASSLICKVTRPLSATDLQEIDLVMTSERNIPNLIDFAIAKSSTIKLDRAEVFRPRLNLAKIQWLFERERHHEAAKEIVNFFKQDNKLNSSLANDFIELFQRGFSIRRLYETDHKL